MGSQGGGGESNGKHAQLQPLARQNSLYTLTLDEVQNQLGDLGKPLASMNLDELLKNVWTAEANQSLGMDIDRTTQANQAALQHQSSLSITSALGKKTVDEVWRDIQQNKDNNEKKSRERQATLGEMTLEAFLAKAGVGIVVEPSCNTKSAGPLAVADSNLTAPPFPPQGPMMQYAQPPYQHPQQSLMGMYMTGQNIAQPLHMGAGGALDVPYADGQVAMPSPLMGTLSDTKIPGRKRGTPEDIMEKTVERRQKRMIKNRESAARSRARKQAYTTELENKVSRLEEENEKLRKRKELENMLSSAPPPPQPRYQIRRTSSASF
ncbi:hypothetical protein PIB30_004492 [Stylosanthes scabra]|uniref:BZIP domain-containing protein n=1 Tax=Stylosanthes scabra TaxID=79078 RepID=A0ABU6X399_9FABA|nr:hypothetical protein [Stylosanthes scabra]